MSGNLKRLKTNIALIAMKRRQEEERKKFESSYMELGKGVLKSLDCYTTRNNNNITVIGPSGSGKTRALFAPMVATLTGSAIISDPKGFLARRFRRRLRRMGYRVIRLCLNHMEVSAHYNPLEFAKTDEDIIRIAHYIAYSHGRGSENGHIDPFWDEMTEVMLSAAIAYVLESNKIPEEKKNLHTVSKILAHINDDSLLEEEDNTEEQQGECNKTSFGWIRPGYTVEGMFLELSREKGKSCLAWRQYCKLKQFMGTRTMQSVIASAQAVMQVFEGSATMQMLSSNDIDFRKVADEKTVIFVEASDTDRSKDGIANLFFAQAMNELCNYADSFEDGSLPIPVRIILDDFATNVRIENFDNIISNIRSRRISTVIACQSESQLRDMYGDAKAQTIMENCDTVMYLGCNHLDSARSIAERAGIPVREALTMKIGTAWLFIRGTEGRLIELWDLDEFLQEKQIDFTDIEEPVK